MIEHRLAIRIHGSGGVQEREVTVSQQLLRRYQQTLGAFVEQAKSFCNRRSITYVPAQSDQAADLLIAQYLRQRGLIR